MKKTLLSTALILGSFAATSFAGTSFLGGPGNLSGSLGAGFANYYNYHNMVPTSGYVDRGATTIDASLKYEIPDTIDYVATFSHTYLNTPTITPISLLDQGGIFPDYNINDATNIFVGIQGERIKGLTTSIGYNLADGGLPGFMSDMRRVSKSNGEKILGDGPNMDHQIRFNALYQVPNSGWFFNGSVSYSFNGTNGWLMDIGLGYDWKLSDRVSIIVAGDVSFSQDYMTSLDAYGYGQKFNGTDGYSIKVCAPMRLTETVTLTPYIAGMWAGHNPIAANKSLEMYDFPGMFKDFAPVAGVYVSWNF